MNDDLKRAEMADKQAAAQQAIADDETKSEKERTEARFQVNKHTQWAAYYRERAAMS
jgi:hypothetical protein